VRTIELVKDTVTPETLRYLFTAFSSLHAKYLKLVVQWAGSFKPIQVAIGGYKPADIVASDVNLFPWASDCLRLAEIWARDQIRRGSQGRKIRGGATVNIQAGVLE